MEFYLTVAALFAVLSEEYEIVLVISFLFCFLRNRHGGALLLPPIVSLTNRVFYGAKGTVS